MLGFDLTPEQEELRVKAREFARKEVLPRAWAWEETDEVPVHVLEKAWEAGIMSTDIPTQYGGKGYGLIESAILTEELAAACPGLATSIFDSSLGMAPLQMCENEPLRQRIFTEAASRFTLIAFATSEPSMGSDVAGMHCRARKEGDGYVLNGTKFWITNGGIAKYFTIFATTDPKDKHGGIGAFLVERDMPGVSTSPPIPKLGQRTSNTAGVRLKDVYVPMANVLAEPGKGFLLAMKTFSVTRPIIGSFAVGAARSAMEFALDYARKRHAFGAKLGDFQAIQFKIAEMYQKVETARLLTWKAAWEAMQGKDATVTASIAKMYATEAGQEVVDMAVQIFGGYGYTRFFPIEKFFRDSRLFRIYEGTSEIQRVIVAGYVLAGYKPVMPPLEDLPMLKDKEAAEKLANGESPGAWRCPVCGYIHYGPEPPEECPYCYMPRAAFREMKPLPEPGSGQIEPPPREKPPKEKPEAS